jgi:ABC-2 type transport system ATP-binding protein
MASGTRVERESRRAEVTVSDCAPVACRGLGFSYPDGTRAVCGIDLRLGKGELYCLLGPNGAGKTTLLRLISGDLRPSSGDVSLFGRDVHADPFRARRSLGITPQGAGLFEELTVEEHYRYFGPLKGLTARRTRSEMTRLARECDLEQVWKRRVRGLSGGERRRVFIGLALLGDPEVLLLDEPTVGLDPHARRTVWRAIRAQADAGRAILLTTHYMDEAERLADRVGFLQAGRVTHSGSVAELHATLDRSVRLTRLDEETGATLEHRYYKELREAHDYARQNALASYSVGRVSLEDIYLQLIGREMPGIDPVDRETADL